MDFKEFRETYQKREVGEYPHKVCPTPLVSVMVQTYNHKNSIKDCLDAILKQETNFPIEILIGEDFSSDGTRNLCIEYGKNFPEKVRLFLHHPENKIHILGITTGNFNAFYNFYSARGEYIAFCEGDDIWTDPYKLQKEVDFLERNPEFVLTYHQFITINEENKEIRSEIECNQPKVDLRRDHLQRLHYHPLLLCTCFRNVFKEIPLQMTEVINVDSFVFSLLGNHGKGKFLKEITPSHYRKHGGGIWSERTRYKKLNLKILVYQKLTEFYTDQGNLALAKFFKVQSKNTMKMLIYRFIKSGEFFKGFRALKDFICLNKFL